MMELTNEYIDSLINKADKKVYITPDNRAMTIIATFPCGWVMSSTTNIVNRQKFIKEELYDKCLNDIKSEVWKLEIYRKTVDNYKKTLRQEKTVEVKTEDKPLGYQEAIKTYKKICKSTAECIKCPLDSDNNGTQTSCKYFISEYTEKAEPILKK